MKKSDLRSGMVVEIRSGVLFLVIDDFIANDNEFYVLKEIKNNLKNKSSFKDFDIVKVYERYNPIYDNYASSLKTLFDKKQLKLLWERKEIALTDREKEVLKALDILGFNWLARDKSGKLFVYKSTPVKESFIWNDEEEEDYFPIKENDLLNFIKWEDKKPTNIKELLK